MNIHYYYSESVFVRPQIGAHASSPPPFLEKAITGGGRFWAKEDHYAYEQERGLFEGGGGGLLALLAHLSTKKALGTQKYIRCPKKETHF